jgi:hypothetical protein
MKISQEGNCDLGHGHEVNTSALIKSYVNIGANLQAMKVT